MNYGELAGNRIGWRGEGIVSKGDRIGWTLDMGREGIELE